MEQINPSSPMAFTPRDKTILFAKAKKEEEDDFDYDGMDDSDVEEDDDFYDDEEDDDDDDEDDDDEEEIEEEYTEYDEDDEDDDEELVEEEEEEEGEEIEAEYEEEEEYEYEEVEEEEDFDDEDWDEEVYELEDDGSDPNYTKQKELMEHSIEAREQQAEDEDFDALQFIMEKMSDGDAAEFDKTTFMQQVEANTKGMLLSEEDIEGIDVEAKIDTVSNLMDDDPYPTHEEGEVNYLEQNTGITDKDMQDLDDAWKTMKEAQTLESWDKVTMKEDGFDWDGLDNETLSEMEACLEEIGGSAYNSTKWLLYDLDFNVTNLMLAAVKHNRNAPILFQHWYPQLLTYKRYEGDRDKAFDWSWDDVQSADISELERYYAGFGYDEIPAKAPAETGIISLESLDEEEIRMAAFENWMTDVYNPEWDRKDFDDDDFRDEDNVFSDFFEAPQHPDVPTYDDAQEDLVEFAEELGEDLDEEAKEYKEFMGKDLQYKVTDDEEFDKVFRGHLVVACTAADTDLEIAEKITGRMSEEFGKQVFVETRVMAHAREEDNVFEIWLESYDIDLLHSKKRASTDTKGHEGQMTCNDEQIEHLVERVGFLISDDARYSYRLFDDALQY